MDDNTYDSLLSVVESLTKRITEQVSGIRTDYLQPVANNFAQNTHSTCGLLSLPSVLIQRGVIREAVDHFAAIANLLKKSEESGPPKKRRRFISAAGIMEYTKFLETHEVWSITRQASKLNAELFEGDAAVQESMRVLFAASLSQLWTTFEVVATDVWVEAVNAHPDTLAARAIKGKSSKVESNEFPDKQITVSLLAEYRFDIRHRMGTLLKNKFAFHAGLPKIYSAYKAIFNKPNEFDDLRTVFENTDLAILEAMRHLIVHRAGLVDKKFNRQTRASFAEGQPLPLDAATVSRLASSAVNSGCRLLTFTDEWLINN